MKTKTKITFEKHERRTIRLRRQNRTAWCRHCAAETEMLALVEAAAVSNTTQMKIFRCVENGELHFIETDTGELLICRNSLTDENFLIT